MSDKPKQPDINERIVFGMAPPPKDTNLPGTIIIGIPEDAFTYMKDGKTNTIDLSKAGVPIQVILFGGKDHQACKDMIDQHNKNQGIEALDVREDDFSIKAK